METDLNAMNVVKSAFVAYRSEEVLNGGADDRKMVANAWETVLKGTGLAPIDIHTPLWLWSRAGFPSLLEIQR
ncbi:hypothetical protein [Solibacillus daqui]|uniref:hypothetical protein n=1 Tax=Solibacillus daqui TaxID=2912187 RepID=UPI0023673B08|nr:hypothetical protein [Solibacillus daqui]